MQTKPKQTDRWSDLFKQLPEEALPASFHLNVMQEIRKEAVRRKKRKARMEWIGMAAAAMGIIGIASAALAYIGPLQIAFPRINISGMISSGLCFYLYIGLLSLLLLVADYRLRRTFGKDAQK